MNRETKAQNKKKTSQAIFFFFPVVRQKSNIYIQRKPKKKSLKRNRLSNHIKCPQNTHTPQIHPLSSNATNSRNTREENAQERDRDGARKEREKKRQTPGDEMPAVISPAGHGLPSQ
jgi:hypothetical protein